MRKPCFRILTMLLALLAICLAIPTVAYAAPSASYSYECSPEEPDKMLVRHFEHNDAIDSWSLETTSQYPDGMQLALKPTFSPARTHLTFSFEIVQAGEYFLVIKYYSTPDNDDRRICLQIDSLGKQDLSCTDSPTKDYQDPSNAMYMIVPIDLKAGAHTFSVYAPMAFGESENGKTVNSPNLISYDLYAGVPTRLFYQKAEKSNSDGRLNIRFLAVIDSLEYQNVGFTVQATKINAAGETLSKEVTLTATTVYKSVHSLGEDVTAESLGGKYIAAVELTGIDCENYNHALSISAFLTEKDGTVLQTRMRQIMLNMPININGTDLKEFTILKPTDTNITSSVTEALCNSLESVMGTSFAVSQTRPADTPCIRLEIDENAPLMTYGYRVENGDLVLYSGGAYSMYRAVRNAVGLLRSKTDKTDISLKDGDGATLSLLNAPDGLNRAENSDLRLMSCNIMANGFDAAFEGWSDTGDITFEMRTEIFEAFLEVYDPDVIGLQEFCPSWYAFFESDLKNTNWKLSNASAQGARPYFLNPIMYRSDRYREVANSAGWVNYSLSRSQGWGGRYMSWLALDSIATGERFVLLNVHWDGWSLPNENAVQVRETLAKAKELQAAYGCQVLITGDFNTRDGTATTDPDTGYTAFLADGTLKDSKYYTQKLVNTDGSLHAWGDGAWARPYSFDHIFCTTGTTVRQFYTAWENHQQYASDHAWLIADIDLSTTVSS